MEAERLQVQGHESMSLPPPKISVFYTLIMNYKKRNKDKILFTVASETAKYTGIYLAKEVREVYTENYIWLAF